MSWYFFGGKNAGSLLGPIHYNALEVFPKFRRVLALEIERVNVLVFCRRILRILHGSIRAFAKPFAVLFHIRMIRRTLIRDVEGDFQSQVACLALQFLEISQSSQLRLNRFVSALCSANGPRASHIASCRSQRVVFALALRDSNRMNGRKV